MEALTFLTATNVDILNISRSYQFKELLNAVDTVSDYGYEFDDFSVNTTVELLLAGEALSLDDVEEFAKYNLDKDGNCCMYDSNKTFSTRYDELLYETVNITFDQYKDYSLNESGGIHQLQYDSYKYIEKHV